MLTGRIAWRRGWFGKLILRVEYRYPDGYHGDWCLAWRDATETDLARLGVAALNMGTVK